MILDGLLILTSLLMASAMGVAIVEIVRESR